MMGKYSIENYLNEFRTINEKVRADELYKEFHPFSQTILTTWTVTLKKFLEYGNEGRKNLRTLNIMAYFACNEIYINKFFNVDDCRLLEKYSIINVTGNVEKKASIPGTVQELIRNKMSKDEELLTLEDAFNALRYADVETSIQNKHAGYVYLHACDHKKFYAHRNCLQSKDDWEKFKNTIMSNSDSKSFDSNVEYLRIKYKEHFADALNFYNVLHVAAIYSDVGTVRRLLAYGADINKISDSNTPILSAARAENWDVVKFLFLQNADIDLRSDDGTSVLDIVIDKNDVDTVKLVRDKSVSNC